jgi:hypothetical protein
MLISPVPFRAGCVRRWSKAFVHFAAFIGKSGYQNLRNDRVRGMPLRGPAPHGHRPRGTN